VSEFSHARIVLHVIPGGMIQSLSSSRA
jgi:hypothetical protein